MLNCADCRISLSYVCVWCIGRAGTSAEQVDKILKVLAKAKFVLVDKPGIYMLNYKHVMDNLRMASMESILTVSSAMQCSVTDVLSLQSFVRRQNLLEEG